MRGTGADVERLGGAGWDGGGLRTYYTWLDDVFLVTNNEGWQAEVGDA